MGSNSFVSLLDNWNEINRRSFKKRALCPKTKKIVPL